MPNKKYKQTKEHKENEKLAHIGKPSNKRAGLGWRKYDLPLLKETDWAYIAGIIDGEGSIFIQKNGKSKYKIVTLTVSNIDLEMLEWMKNKLNAGAIYILKCHPNRKQCYKWQNSAHKVVYTILIKMLPYLKIKRDKAIEAISFIRDKEIKS